MGREKRGTVTSQWIPTTTSLTAGYSNRKQGNNKERQKEEADRGVERQKELQRHPEPMRYGGRSEMWICPNDSLSPIG